MFEARAVLRCHMEVQPCPGTVPGEGPNQGNGSPSREHSPSLSENGRLLQTNGPTSTDGHLVYGRL